MPSFRSKKLSDAPDMVNVELHRADSLVNHSIDLKTITGEQNYYDVYSYTTSKFCNVIKCMKFMGLEVIMFMYMFSYVVRSISSMSMIVDKACLVHLGHSEEICTHLSEHPDIKNEVEKLANNYHMGHTLIQTIPSSILACFIGAWSDRYSRKVPIIIALVGIILDGLGATICAAITSSRIEFYYIPALFTGLSGGFISVLTVLYSYASDVSTFGKRTMKYAIMEMAFGLSLPLGQLAGGTLFKYYGYVPVFLTSTAGHVFGLAWVLFILDETRGMENTDSWREKFNNFWSFKPVIESFKATVKARPNKGREQILLLIICMSLAILSLASTANISFLYVHHLYDWDNTTFSYISAIFSVIGVVLTLICVPIFKGFKLGDATLGIVGSLSLVAKNLGIGVAKRKGVYFLGNLLGLLSGLCTLAGRSRISKVASKNDLGKIFSFLTTAESVFPIAASAVVAQVFNATLDFYPGIVYLGLAGLCSISLFIYIWLAFLPAVDYEEMQNSAPTEKEEKSVDTCKKEKIAS